MRSGLGLFFSGLASAHSQEVSWDRVADLFSSDEAVRDEALASERHPSSIAGLNDVLYYHCVVRDPRDEGQIVEIVATIALFGYLNRWNDTMATDLEGYPRSVGARAIAASGSTPGKRSH